MSGWQERQALGWELDKIAAPTRPCHWIKTPNGDQGNEWCPHCGYFKVRNMRRRDRRRGADYILDGGWRTDSDIMPMCHACGAYLDASLTSYGASEQLEYYREAGLNGPRDVDALYLSEILNSLSEKDTEGLALATDLARKILSTPSKTQEG